jgi:3-oxoacyl-[acyl-carrier-protein] synthase III
MHLTNMTNIKIREVSIYHPKNSVGNEFYIEHFKKQGRDITNLLNAMGRKDRYIIDNETENTLTMGIEASKNVLRKAGLEGKDIDMIVFSTQVPEQTFPSNAMLLHHEIGADAHVIAFDSNANCAGMTVAVENATRYMLSNPHVNRALVVGSDYNSLIANKDEEITYANYGDASSAVILEKTEEDTGFIDAMHYSNSDGRLNVLYPEFGLSKAIKGNGNVDAIRWLPFDASYILPATYELLEKLLNRNQMTIEDIDSFCLSQFAISNIERIQEHYNIPSEKAIFIGDKFGYTSTSSPFIALHEGVESGRIKRGDTVLFWTIGTGDVLIAMLYKY